MGKDQELLSAARNGNVTQIEKILSQRGKRSGPLASLRRGPGANIQDKAGYSALHFASLYGHTDCVRLLLSYEASPSLRDSRHSSPLHLAAWAGHQDIVKLLLTQSNRPADPNLQTIDKATPLHCAALYGHTGALTTLLAHGADPNIMDNRGEKPLDLAAQYGHLQVVQILVRAHPELLLPYKKHSNKCREIDYRNQKILKHSPLHSASRNGHKHVVELLLTAGIDVNLVTATGTALHEAALCGKDSVVRILLEFGADLGVTDPEGRTAMDLLEQFPPNVTKGIVAVIRDYQNSITMSGSEQEDILKVSRSIPSHGSFNDDRISRTSRGSHVWSSYTPDDDSMLESPSSPGGSLDPSSPNFRANGPNDMGNYYVTMISSNPKVSPTPPKKPPRRSIPISPSSSKPLFTQRNFSGSSSTVSDYLSMTRTAEKKIPVIKATSVDHSQNYVEMMSPAARQKHEAVLKQLNENLLKDAAGVDNDEGITLRSYNPNRKLRRIRDNYDLGTNGSRTNHGHFTGGSGEEPMSPSNYKQPPTPEHPPPTARTAEKTILERIRPLSQEYRRSIAMFEYVARGGHNGTATFGGYDNRNRLKNEKRQSVPHPLKPHHQQPPPPKQQQPQPNHQHSVQAANINAPHLLHARHRSSNYRDSSLSPCSSDVIMSHSLNASSGSLSSVSLSDRSESTDCVEYIADVPFAGLFKGSTMTLDNPNLITHGMSNSHSDYKYYQAMVSEQHNKYHGALNSHENRKLKSPQYQEQAQNSVQSSRLERPKTLDTHSTASPSSNQKPATAGPVQSAHTVTARATSETNNKTNTSISAARSLHSTDRQNSNNDTPPTTLPFDEQEEWKKISEIMANFGTDTDALHDSVLFAGAKANAKLPAAHDADLNGDGPNGGAPVDDTAASPPDRCPLPEAHARVRQFLGDNRLGELLDIFLDNGYDDVDFIKGILEENDLDTLDVRIELRQRLMGAIDADLQKPARAISTVTKSATTSAFDNAVISPMTDGGQQENSSAELNANGNNNHINNNNGANDNGNYNSTPSPTPTNLANSNCNEMPSVDEWLKNIRLPQYAEVFRKHLYADMERISRIWEIELQAVLEINKIGHRKRMLYSVGAVPPKSDRLFDSKLTKFANNGDTSKAGSSQRSSVSLSSHENSDPPCEHRPSRKTRQAPKPPIQKPTRPAHEGLAEQTANLEIRAPSELLLGVPPNLRTQWRHSAEILITSAVKYEVNYLGSTIVKELRGTESTRKSIEKLKRKEQLVVAGNPTTVSLTKHTQHNTRAVNILISYRGVQFVDPQTQGTICEHEIRNINCACQDADDLSHFAYITKDADNHYCHVFNVTSMDLATEIILTLGQAFEVAYQIALRRSTPTTPIRSSPARITLEK